MIVENSRVLNDINRNVYIDKLIAYIYRWVLYIINIINGHSEKIISGNESIERLAFETECWDWMQWENKILFPPYTLQTFGLFHL